MAALRASLTLDLSGLRSSVGEARALLQTLPGISRGVFEQLRSAASAGMAGVSGAITSGAVQMRLRMSEQLVRLRTETERSLGGLPEAARAQIPAMSSAGAAMVGALASGMRAALPAALEAIDEVAAELAEAMQSIRTSPGTGGQGLSPAGSAQVSVNVVGGLNPSQLKREVQKAVGSVLMTK